MPLAAKCIIKKKNGDKKEIDTTADKLEPIFKIIKKNTPMEYDEQAILKLKIKKGKHFERYNKALLKCKRLVDEKTILISKMDNQTNSEVIKKEIFQITKELNKRFYSLCILKQKSFEHEKELNSLKKTPLNPMSYNSILSINTKRNKTL